MVRREASLLKVTLKRASKEDELRVSPGARGVFRGVRALQYRRLVVRSRCLARVDGKGANELGSHQDPPMAGMVCGMTSRCHSGVLAAIPFPWFAWFH